MIHKRYLKLQKYFKNIILRTFCETCTAVPNNHILIRPYLDFGIILQDMENLKLNLKRRNMDLDVDTLKLLWPVFKKCAIHKHLLETNNKAIENRLIYLKKAKRFDDDINLQNHYTLLKTQLNYVLNNFNKLEGMIVPHCLLIPNKLHPDTQDDDFVIHSFTPNQNIKTGTHHLQVANRLSLVEYRNPICIFLIEDAAIFELAVLKYFLLELENRDYSQFSNPDIVTSITVEGCGYDSTDPYETFILEKNKGHLVGGASLFSFCAFYARHSVNNKYLPERSFSIGRQYVPPPDKDHDGLYSAAQKSAVQIFNVTENSFDHLMSEFDAILEVVKNIYNKIGLNYRITYTKAQNLTRNESLRASIQLYSPYRQTYVEIGNVSICNDYISRRLFMYYHKVVSENFLNVITGTIVNIPTLLACLLEYSESEPELVIPACIKSNMFEKGGSWDVF